MPAGCVLDERCRETLGRLTENRTHQLRSVPFGDRLKEPSSLCITDVSEISAIAVTKHADHSESFTY
jgi:hypothetical protein